MIDGPSLARFLCEVVEKTIRRPVVLTEFWFLFQHAFGVAMCIKGFLFCFVFGPLYLFCFITFVLVFIFCIFLFFSFFRFVILCTVLLIFLVFNFLLFWRKSYFSSSFLRSQHKSGHLFVRILGHHTMLTVSKRVVSLVSDAAARSFRCWSFVSPLLQMLTANYYNLGWDACLAVASVLS